MKLILDTLERARLAASPSDAIILADAIAELSDLADVLAARGMDLSDALPAIGIRYALRDHVASQPFEVADDLLPQGDVVRGPIIDELTPDAFADWLATLESLAQ